MNFYNKLINRNDSANREQKFEGIRGWLLFPAISMLTTPLVLIGFIHINFKMINNSLIKEVFVEHPEFRAAMISQTSIVSMQLVFVIYIAFLFFKRKRTLPSMIIAFLTIHLLIVIANLSWIFTIFKEINYPEYSGLTGAIFMTAVGIPYFMKSKRVKATFVNP